MNNGSTWFANSSSPKRSGDSLVGLTIDRRYSVINELGHGGVGAIYLARDLRLHEKPVVVKVLLEKSTHDQWIAKKFLQEKEALARVEHPGVVGILDAGELPNGKPYLVMQFIDGISLREAIKDSPDGMELARAASIFRQIGSALSAVHLKKIYHRDLKPENIMLQTLGPHDEQVKIVDFGIAKIKESVVGPSTATGTTTAGTLLYMSPEQLQGVKVTAASDIYSFGVIAYELVTGRRPFNPSTIANLIDMQREGVRVKPADLRPVLPAEAQTIIVRAIELEPKARFQSAAEFGNLLADALLNEDESPWYRQVMKAQLASTLVSEESPRTPAQQVSTPPAVVKRWTARPLLIVTIASLVLVLSSVLIALYVNKWNSRVLLQGATNHIAIESRFLIYSLTVQKMRDGKPYQQPFQSSGQEIFESGYKFKLNVSTPQSGYLYVFNQGADEQTGTSFTIIYPTPLTKQGSAAIEANEAMQTNWNIFAGKPGTEVFWIVWSASPINELEAAKTAAFQDKEGALTNSAMITTVKDFFFKHSDPKLQVIKDTAQQQTIVRGSGDLLVKFLELEHR
jgi:serine/threonine protein kinase